MKKNTVSRAGALAGLAVFCAVFYSPNNWVE